MTLNGLWNRFVKGSANDEPTADDAPSLNRGDDLQADLVSLFSVCGLPVCTDGKLDECKQFEMGAMLVTQNRYNDGIEAFQKLAQLYPEKRKFCEEQIGAACYQLGKYKNAIDYYMAARVHGADAAAIDDKIWQACELLYKLCSDPVKKREPLKKYLTLFANGKHAQDAQRLLGCGLNNRHENFA